MVTSVLCLGVYVVWVFWRMRAAGIGAVAFSIGELLMWLVVGGVVTPVIAYLVQTVSR
jgi:hypothetical protein